GGGAPYALTAFPYVTETLLDDARMIVQVEQARADDDGIEQQEQDDERHGEGNGVAVEAAPQEEPEDEADHAEQKRRDNLHGDVAAQLGAEVGQRQLLEPV